MPEYRLTSAQFQLLEALLDEMPGRFAVPLADLLRQVMRQPLESN